MFSIPNTFIATSSRTFIIISIYCFVYLSTFCLLISGIVSFLNTKSLISGSLILKCVYISSSVILTIGNFWFSIITVENPSLP